MDLTWPDPWWNIENDSDLREGIHREMTLEIGPTHPLYGMEAIVIAKSDAADDVIVELNNGKYASVHLVWHGKIDQKPEKFPRFNLFETKSELQNYINEYAKDYT